MWPLRRASLQEYSPAYQKWASDILLSTDVFNNLLWRPWTLDLPQKLYSEMGKFMYQILEESLPPHPHLLPCETSLWRWTKCPDAEGEARKLIFRRTTPGRG